MTDHGYKCVPFSPEGFSPGEVDAIRFIHVPENGDEHSTLAPLSPLTLAEFLALKLPPRELLLAPVLPRQGIAMLYGPRGCGKTQLAVGTALAVGTGSDFLRWRAPEPRRVLYIDGEMPAPALQERFSAARQRTSNASLADQNVQVLAADMFRDGLPDLGTENGRAAFEPLVEGFDLLIVDNISTLCRTGKENEAEGWGQLQAWALAQRRAGRSVLFLHHAGKNGDQRGTSRREDVMDTVMRLSLPKDYEQAEGARFVVEYTKARGFTGEEAEPFEAWLKDGIWTVRDATSARDEQIMACKAAGLTQREIAAEVGCSLSTVNRVLKRSNFQ